MEYKIIIDTREKKTEHITKQFDKNNIPYERRKLSVGDYAIQNSDGVTPPVVIERKTSLDELIGNLIDKKSHDGHNNRFIREIIAAEALGYKLIILVENANYYEDLLKGNYRSKIKPNAAAGLILSLLAKYPHVHIAAVDPSLSASYINRILRLHLQEVLKEQSPKNLT